MSSNTHTDNAHTHPNSPRTPRTSTPTPGTPLRQPRSRHPPPTTIRSAADSSPSFTNYRQSPNTNLSPDSDSDEPHAFHTSEPYNVIPGFRSPVLAAQTIHKAESTAAASPSTGGPQNRTPPQTILVGNDPQPISVESLRQLPNPQNPGLAIPSTLPRATRTDPVKTHRRNPSYHGYHVHDGPELFFHITPETASTTSSIKSTHSRSPDDSPESRSPTTQISGRSIATPEHQSHQTPHTPDPEGAKTVQTETLRVLQQQASQLHERLPPLDPETQPTEDTPISRHVPAQILSGNPTVHPQHQPPQLQRPQSIPDGPPTATHQTPPTVNPNTNQQKANNGTNRQNHNSEYPKSTSHSRSPVHTPPPPPDSPPIFQPPPFYHRSHRSDNMSSPTDLTDAQRESIQSEIVALTNKATANDIRRLIDSYKNSLAMAQIAYDMTESF